MRNSIIKNILLLLGIFLLVNANTNAQGLLLKSANKSFYRYHYVRAMEMYEQIIAKDSLHYEALTKLSICYDKLQDTKNEERILKRLYSVNALTPELTLKYASVLAENGDYATAQKVYAKLSDPKSKAFATAYQNMTPLFKDSIKYTIYDLKELNSPLADFSPVYYQKGMVFVSARTHHKSHNKAYAWNNTPFLNIYIVDTTKLKKTVYKTDVSDEFVSENHVFHAAAVHDHSHTDVTEHNPNDSRTHGHYSPIDYHLAFENANIKMFGKKINTKFHEGPVAFSADGKTIYFTRSNFHKGKYGKSTDGINKLKIYYATLNTDSTWVNITEFPYNSDEYSTGTPSIHKSNKIMYFVSDMPGGVGGKDIYYSVWENDKWGKPVNCGPTINTPDNEMFPYISTDSVLYFSSDGHVGLGGLDLFSINLKNKNAKVKNLGFPMNSKKDDFGIALNSNNSTGYFSSNRKRNTHDDDIYYFNKINHVFVKGQIVDKVTKKKISNAYVYIKDSKGKVIDSTFTDKNGNYIIQDLEPDKEYKVDIKRAGYIGDSMIVKTFKKLDGDTVPANIDLKRGKLKVEGYVVTTDTKEPLPNVAIEIYNDCTGKIEKATTNSKGFYSVDLKPNCCYVLSTILPNCGDLSTKTDATQIEKDIYRLDLNVLCKGDVIKIDNIYYDLEKWDLKPEALKELDKLLALFKDYPELKIELRSHTDCRSSATYNQKLSDKRAKTAVDYLVSKGISRKQIVGKGYGEKMLVNDCACEDFKSKRNCSEEEHQLNRRTEIVILSVGQFNPEKHRLRVHSLCHE